VNLNLVWLGAILLLIGVGLFLLTGSGGDASEYHCERWWQC
jgi:hypothetical protein